MSHYKNIYVIQFPTLFFPTVLEYFWLSLCCYINLEAWLEHFSHDYIHIIEYCYVELYMNMFVDCIGWMNMVMNLSYLIII